MNIHFKIKFLIVVSLISFAAKGQYSITGSIATESDTIPVSDYHIVLNNGKYSTTADSLGNFKFTGLPNGKYSLYATSSYFKPYHQNLTIKDQDVTLTIKPTPDFKTVEEIVVERKGDDATYLRGVENMGIYEGKKSEVIVPEKLIANLATNNARQVYSRVA